MFKRDFTIQHGAEYLQLKGDDVCAHAVNAHVPSQERRQVDLYGMEEFKIGGKHLSLKIFYYICNIAGRRDGGIFTTVGAYFQILTLRHITGVGAHLFAPFIVLNYRPVLLVQRVPHHDAVTVRSLGVTSFDHQRGDVVCHVEIKLKH